MAISIPQVLESPYGLLLASISCCDLGGDVANIGHIWQGRVRESWHW